MVKYTYDDFDRITGVKYDSETANRYTYGYGSNGQAAEVKDTNLSRITRTEFDLSDRPCKVEVTDLNDNLVYRTQLKYDKRSNLHSFSEKLPSETHTTTYTYDNDNRITNIAYDGTANKVTYTYDSLGRVNTRAANSYTTTFGYVAGGHGTKSTTPLVASITQPNMNFSYTYDNRGNITSETRNGSTTTYVYDGLGQLTRVNDPHENATWVYTYDRGGNIQNKKRYPYTTGTLGTAAESIDYKYEDSNWKDKLTKYGNATITYDAIGNPTNDGTWNYVWNAGRQLKQMSKTGTTINFKYNHNGLRTQKAVTVNGVTTTTNYTYHGKLVTHMTRGSDNLHFFYDSASKPAFVKYNGTMYRYVHNLQGDIVGIIDSNNSLVVEYKYDAWGKHISTAFEAGIGAINPFRYRSYMWDEESALYYLRSRYYSFTSCRYINADTRIGSASIVSHALYTYCKNAPVICQDPTGKIHEFGAGGVGTSSVFASEQMVRTDIVTSRTVKYTQDYLDGSTVITEYTITFYPLDVIRAMAAKATEAQSQGKMKQIENDYLEQLVNATVDGSGIVGSMFGKFSHDLAVVLGASSVIASAVAFLVGGFVVGSIAHLRGKGNNILINAYNSALGKAETNYTGVAHIQKTVINISTGNICSTEFFDEWSSWVDFA